MSSCGHGRFYTTYVPLDSRVYARSYHGYRGIPRVLDGRQNCAEARGSWANTTTSAGPLIRMTVRSCQREENILRVPKERETKFKISTVQLVVTSHIPPSQQEVPSPRHLSVLYTQSSDISNRMLAYMHDKSSDANFETTQTNEGLFLS